MQGTTKRKLSLLEQLADVRDERDRIAAQFEARAFFRSPEWQAIQAVIVDELGDLPDVRVRIAARLAELGM